MRSGTSLHCHCLLLISGSFQSLAFTSCPPPLSEPFNCGLGIFWLGPKSEEHCKSTQRLDPRVLLSSLLCPALHPAPFFQGTISGPPPRQLHGAEYQATFCSPPHLHAERTERAGGFVLVYRANPKKLFFCSALGHHTLGRLLIPASLGLADAPCFLPSTPTMATLRLP